MCGSIECSVTIFFTIRIYNSFILIVCGIPSNKLNKYAQYSIINKASVSSMIPGG